MTRQALILAACLSAAACATPAERVRIVEKMVPVAEKPIAAGDVPRVPAPLGKRPATASAAADLLLAKHCEWVGYAEVAQQLLALSAGLPPATPLRFPECGDRPR